MRSIKALVLSIFALLNVFSIAPVVEAQEETDIFQEVTVEDLKFDPDELDALRFDIPDFTDPEPIEIVKSEPVEIEEEEVVEEVPEEPEYGLSDEEIDLIALITMAEAEAEPEEGKRLVIDTILNRVDSPYFPNTVNGVIYQPNQYSCVWSDRLSRCEVREDIVQLVREELLNRTNSEVVFFRTLHYHSFGVPVMQVGHHYFSKYN